MDKIILKDMAFFGYHGVLQEENKLGQKFIVTVEMTVDLLKAGKSDDVEDTVSYAEIYTMVKDWVEKKQFKLIEALAQSIAEDILKHFSKVKEVYIQVKKPEAPIAGIFDYAAVEIRRQQDAQ